VPELCILGYRDEHRVMKPDTECLRPLHELPPPRCRVSLQQALGLFAYYAKRIPHFSDRIARPTNANQFPLDKQCVDDFESLKTTIANASKQTVDELLPFVVECDASEVAVPATLNQMRRLVAFMSSSQSQSELHYSSVEEATVIIEVVR